MSKRKYTDSEFREAVRGSNTRAEVMRKLGLSVSCGNYRTVNRLVGELGLDISHFTGKAHGTSIPRNKKALSEVMVANSSYNPGHLKARLIKNGMMENRCSICGLGSIWNGNKLNMVLDHINGDHRDHRRENLRLLCPNCNSQQPTFCRGIVN